MCSDSDALEPPCSALHPSGSSGLVPTYVEGGLPSTLTDSAIVVDDFGAEQTAAFENVRKREYCPEPDPAYGWGIPTRGFGETGRGITRSSACISYATAVRNLRYLLDADYCYPLRSMGVNFSHLQTDALCDLSYNAGPGSLYDIEGYLKAHEWSGACSYIKAHWSSANGKFLSGLFNRRVEECGWLAHTERVETPAQHRARVHRERVARLHGDEGSRRALNDVLAHYNCLHGYKDFSHDHARKCTVWRAHHGAVNRDIKRLRALGIR